MDKEISEHAQAIAKILTTKYTPYSKVIIDSEHIKMASTDWSEPVEAKVN